MFKVMITQIMNNKIIGKTVLVDEFETLRAAKMAAKKYSEVYEHQVFQIRYYPDDKANTISFEDNDTGEIVYENLDEIIEEYHKDDLNIVEFLDCILEDESDNLHIVAKCLSDKSLSEILKICGADNWYCIGHQTIEYL